LLVPDVPGAAALLVLPLRGTGTSILKEMLSDA
jgi:hypothetical protein